MVECMKTRNEEIEELISKNKDYMKDVVNLIWKYKSTEAALDFLSKLKSRIALEIEKNRLDNLK